MRPLWWPVVRPALRSAAALFLLLALAACNDGPRPFQGWIEANLIFVGPDEAGRVDTLSVREGDQVEAGKPLMTIDADLQRADLNMNEATLANAKRVFERAEQLIKSGAGTQKDFDAAQAALREAEARVVSSKTRLARRVMVSPVTGTVQQVYFRPGEVVGAGKPVLALLPPGNMKVRFFVPETLLPNFAYGDLINVGCDGCAKDLQARVSFISRTAEFTPPVIYSQEERSKLVFLIEALPTEPARLRVGQPVDVFLAPKGKAPSAEAKP
jgi:HlyD family secretion protein